MMNDRMILLRQHVANVSVLSADVISPFIIFAAFDISPLSVVDEQCSFFTFIFGVLLPIWTVC